MMVLLAGKSVSIQNILWLSKVLPVVQEAPLEKGTIPLLLERKKGRRNTQGGKAFPTGGVG